MWHVFITHLYHFNIFYRDCHCDPRETRPGGGEGGVARRTAPQGAVLVELKLVLLINTCGK